MAVHRWSELTKKMSKERREKVERRVREELLEMDLREMRKLVGKTQQDVAKLAKMAQSELSKTERREDHRLSTLRRYVQALGGELEVIANFGDKRIRLHGV
jgi:transcriptional regulator with XRE-family HTH domain